MSQELFNKALLAAQREFPQITKGKTADMGNFSYKYADLGDIFDAVLPILHKHGIALSQPPHSESGMVGVYTRLIHESGHIEDCGALLLPAGNNPQSAGSAMTYARRYAACAALGIVADEDDDGQVATTSISEAEKVKKLQNRLKARAKDLAGGDVELAKDFYTAYAPESWTKETVDVAELAMVAGVKGDG
jgi:hypothetical protein